MQQVLSYFSTYSPPELRYLAYRGANFCIGRSLLPGIWTSLCQNTVHITFCADKFCLNFVLQGDPLCCQCIECCLASGVMCATHVSSPVMIWSRNLSYCETNYCTLTPLGDVYRRTVCGHRPGSADDEFRSALCPVHLKLCHRSHFTVGGCWNKGLHLKRLQQCYCQNSESSTSACLTRLHYSSRTRTHFTQ